MATKICKDCGKELDINLFDKSKEMKDGHINKCKYCRKEYSIKYLEINKEIIKEKSKEYRKVHKEAIRNTHREYIAKTRVNKPLHIRSKKSENPRDNRNVIQQRRKARKKELLSNLTVKQWLEIKLYFNNKCCYCGRELSLTQEHLIPLSKGGEYTVNNIIPACRSCNCSTCRC